VEKYLTKRQDKLLRLGAILFILATSSARSQSTEDLFQSVFGTDDAVRNIPAIPVPFYLDNQYESELLLYHDQLNNIVEIEGAKLLEILKTRIQKEISETLKTGIDESNDKINLTTVENTGLETYYNKRELALFIDIPSELQSENRINLKDNKTSFQENPIKSSPFSAYLNYYSSVNLNISGNSSNREVILPVSLGLDSVFNYKNFVLESDILLSYKDTIDVADWNARLVKDIEGKNLRLKMGTINYPVTQLQGYIPLNGITIGKNFSLDPSANIQSLGKQSITLQAPSEIEIFVNGRLLKKMDLPKGKYYLENLQLDTGANLVEIKIKELTGREETISFLQPFNISILKKGLSDYSAAFGIYKNNMDTPVFSTYYRYGLSDIFTVGVNLQSDFSMVNGGMTLLLGTNAGNFSLENSVSYDGGFDWGASFFYRYTNSRFNYKNNWSFSATYRGENYNGIRLEKIMNTAPLRLSLYYGQILPGDINAGLTINRNYLSNWEKANTELSLHMSRHFGQGLLMNLFISNKIEDGGESDFTAGLTMTVNLQEKNETITSSASWPGTAIENNWQKSSPLRVPGYNVNAGVSGLPSTTENTPYGFSFGGEYRGYRFTGSVHHNSSILNTNDQSLHNSSFNFSSAVVYADSKFAISRPIFDSFVIISPKDSFSDHTIGINPEGKSYGAILNGKRNSVLSDIRSYRYNQILFEAIDLPIGYDLGESAYSYFPGYKSGSVIYVGSEAAVYAGGTMTDEMGNAIALAAVSLTSLDDPSIEERLFFTNREGYFELYGLFEGEWRLELLEDRNLFADITIPAENIGYFELWNVQLNNKEQ